MEVTEPPKMPVLPPWDQIVPAANGSVWWVILFGGLFICAVFFSTRKNRIAKKKKTAATADKDHIINNNPRNILPDDPELPLLKVGDTITLSFPNKHAPLTTQIINVAERELTVTVPQGSDLTQTEPVGETVIIAMTIGRRTYTLPATVGKYFVKQFTACTLRHRETVTLNYLKQPHKLREEIPALFAVIPQCSIIGDVIPFEDLNNRIIPEFPGNIIMLHFNEATFRTLAPIEFARGDLLMFQALLPDNTGDFSSWGQITSAKREGNGQILEISFLTIDEKLNRYLSAYSAPIDIDETIVR